MSICMINGVVPSIKNILIGTINWQLITAMSQRSKQPFTLTFTVMDNLQLLVLTNVLTCYALKFWRKNLESNQQPACRGVNLNHCYIVPFKKSPPTRDVVNSIFIMKCVTSHLLSFCNPLLTQDVQVDGCGFHQGAEYLLNVLNVEPLLWLPLPTAQHHIIHFLGTEPGSLQHPTLRDALYHLQENMDRNISVEIIQLPAYI